MMKNERSLILVASPMETAELRSIFSDQPGSIRRSLEDPPRLRDNGWDLQTVDQATFLRGELIRLETFRMAVDLYRDGTLIFVGHIYRDFIAWSDRADLRIHPLALIELTVNFTRFYRLVLHDFRVAPRRIAFRVELRNMHLANQKTLLPAGPLAKLPGFWHGVREAPTDAWSKEVVVSSEAYDPDQTAFQLIRELYLWFGHSDEAIPYTKGTGDGMAIDSDQIESIR
jgi:hypothetical protein